MHGCGERGTQIGEKLRGKLGAKIERVKNWDTELAGFVGILILFG